MAYNGWSNYETWNWKLWIDNDQGSYEFWREQAQSVYDESDDHDDDIQTLADLLQNDCDEAYPENMKSGPFADLLNSAISEIDWREIAESMLEDVEKTEEVTTADE